jgi:ketosteroid isomerase-like protein
VDRDKVMRWVAGYERAWRDGDLDAVAELFTEDAARYRPSPYEEAEVGHAAIRAFWRSNWWGGVWEVGRSVAWLGGRHRCW